MAVGREPDRDDGEGVDEPLAIAPVVGDLDLDLIQRLDGLPDLLHGSCVDAGSSPGALRASGSGGLEKAAVSTNHFDWGVAGEMVEGRRGVDDGKIRGFHVADDDGYGVVDGTDVNGWVRSTLDRNLEHR